MAYRGPLREVFGMLCIAMFVPKVEKAIMPMSNTGFIIDHPDDNDVHTINTLPTTTPPTSGFLLYLLALLASALALIGDELLNMAFIYMLNNGLLPFIRVMKRFMKRFFFWIFPSASREASNQTRQPESPAEEDHDDHVRFDTAGSQPASEETPNNTQALVAELRAESASKDTKISDLTRTAKQKSNMLVDRDRQNGRLMSNLRDALDPRGLYTSTTDVVVMATHLANDFDRVSKKIQRQKKQLKKAQDLPENKQLAQKDAQISTLSAENSRLENRVVGLEEGQLQSVQAVEDVEKAAAEREKKLNGRILAAQKTAGEAISPRDYQTLRDQFERVAVELRRVEAERQETLNAQTPLGTELQAERPGMQELTTATENLQLANERIADLEGEARAKDAEVQNAEQRARAAESKVAENAATVTQLEQNLREAQDGETRNATRVNNLEHTVQEAQDRATVNDARVSELERNLKERQDQAGESKVAENAAIVTQLEQDLREAQDEETRNATRVSELEQKLQEAQDRGTVSDARVSELERYLQGRQNQAEEQTTEIDGLRSGLEEAYQRSSHDQQALRQEGRRLIDEAEARLTAAVAVKDAEVAAKDAELTEARELANQLYGRGITQWHRAEAAERRASDSEADVTEQRNRARTAEEEVEKYKQGRNSQDTYINDLHRDLAAAKKKVPTDLDLARIGARENERVRAWALVEESANRSYGETTRGVLTQLINANTKIDELETMLRNGAIRSNGMRYLTVLLNAEVKQDDYEKLDMTKRQVLGTQCLAANEKLMALRHKISTRSSLDKDPLLVELYKPRGDEGARWNSQQFESERESDEDEDNNGGSGRAPDPSSRPKAALPTGLRNRQSQQTERQDTPLPTDPDTNNPLKRKVNAKDIESDGSSKRAFALAMGMRPIAGPLPQPPQFPQQGSSSSEADVDLSETKPESQNELPPSERIGEATAPQQQSNDQAYVPKPTKIPGPQQNAHMTISGRQERLSDDGNAALAEGSTAPATDGPNILSFSGPKDIASGILPHVRKYTRLSGTTNTVLSRHQPNPSTDDP